MKWILFGPEIFTFAAAFCFLFLSMFRKPDSRGDHAFALVLSSLGVAAALASVSAQGLLFSDTYKVDLLSQVFKVLLALGLFLVVCLCRNLEGVQEAWRREFYFLLFVCTLALMLLVSAHHLLPLFVALELSSYSLYILVTLRRDEAMGLEAGIKYFITGIFASAVMLFGMALLYGAAQTLSLADMARALPEAVNSSAALMGLVLTFGGLFFKLAVYPFHYWVADTYQGAPDQLTAYIATASKVAVIAVFIRVTGAWTGDTAYLVHILTALAVTSMTVGNLAAIVQKDLKRLLAYSTVAHSGYVLMGILTLSAMGYAGAVFYAVALLVMKFTVFVVVVAVSREGRNVRLDDLAGLHRRSPLLALALMVSVFSLAGIPPTIGFMGKFLVFVAAMDKGLFALVLIAMINVLVSLYYYLLVIKAAYLSPPAGEEQPAIALSPPMKWLTGALIAVMIGIGFFPYHLVQISEAVARGFM